MVLARAGCVTTHRQVPNPIKVLGGVVALIGIIAAFAHIRSCSDEEARHHPELAITSLAVGMIGNDYFYTWEVCNRGDENATKPHLEFFAIDTTMTRQSSVQAVPPTKASWPILEKGEDHCKSVRLQIDPSAFPYLLICLHYDGEHAPCDDKRLYGPLRKDSDPLHEPHEADDDALKAKLSCQGL
jgi:hypothetical protein